MKKRNIFKRIELFNEGRSCYLEYLRNLTPQVILFSLTLISARNLTSSITFERKWETAISLVFLCGFVLSVYANVSMFYEKCFVRLRRWRRLTRLILRSKGLRGFSFMAANLRAHLRNKMVESIEVVLSMGLFQFALAGVVILSIHSAIDFINSVSAPALKHRVEAVAEKPVFSPTTAPQANPHVDRSLCVNEICMEKADLIQLAILLITAAALIVTIKNFRKQLQLNFFAEYTKRYQEIILNFPESINQKDFDFDLLSSDERSKTLRYMRAYFDLCSEEYFLWKDKRIDEETWKEWESGIKYALSKTAFRNGWERITLDTIYYKDFSSFVKSSINQSAQQT